MKRKACKYCYKWTNQLSGAVVERKVKFTSLPGFGRTLARIYTVECIYCKNRWQYRKKFRSFPRKKYPRKIKYYRRKLKNNRRRK